MADSLYAVGNYSEAIDQLENVSSNSVVIHSRLAKAWEAKGNPKEAAKHYQLVLEQDPNQVLSAVSYGKLLMKMNQLEKADSIFAGLSKKYRKNTTFHYQRGLIKEKQRDSTAIKYFMTTVALDMTHQKALYKVAKDFLAHKQYEQAKFFSKQGLEVNPINASLLSILAQAHFRSDQYKSAIQAFEKLAELGQGSEFIHTKLGYAYYQQKDPKKAIENYKKALEYEDQNAGNHHALGKIYALTGDYDKSEQHLLMAIILKDQLIDAEFLSLALTYKLKEDYKKALEYFEKALEENPMNERALYERAIAADNYFKDLETRRNYYQAYINKFEELGSQNLLYLAKKRRKDLDEEIHMSR